MFKLGIGRSMRGRATRIGLAASTAGLLFSGAAVLSPAHAVVMPPPCPVHQVVGVDSEGLFVWPPGCTGKIHPLSGVSVTGPSVHVDCDGAVVFAGGKEYDVDFLPCPGPAI